jgi:hypothetical protein
MKMDEKEIMDQIRREVKNLVAQTIADNAHPLVGCTIQFPDNEIPYFQDMGFHHGIPKIPFVVESICDKGITLIGPNHGGKPYGNGALLMCWAQKKTTKVP